MAPSHALSSARAVVKRVDWGYVQAGLLSRERIKVGVPTLCTEAEGSIGRGVTGEPRSDPARSENLCM